MTTLAVTRSLVSGTNPTETQFDTMRDNLLDFFNTANVLDVDNLAAGGLLYSSLSSAILDDETLGWTSADGIMTYLSATDKFKIQNTEGNIFFGLKSGSTITRYMELDKTTGLLSLKGVPEINTGVGSQHFDLMWLLSRYQKPKLVHSTDDIVTLEANGSDGLTYVMGHDRLWRVVDTTCSLAVDANGETVADTGAAVSGLGATLTRTDNRWYYIYAVEVQYGDQADGQNCILVANITPPISSNITALNTALGTGKWVYMGVVRNGYNDGANKPGVILPFCVEENGYVMFTQGTDDTEGRGMTLAQNTNGPSNLEYTVDITNNDADSIPPVATRIMVTGYRSAYGFEFHYREVASDENHAVTTSGYHPVDSPTLTGILQLEVPTLNGYKFVVVIGSTDTDKRISLAGFMDHFV